MLKDMASFNSVGGLASAVNNKVGALTSVAKGVMCLPSILTGLPGILGNVAKGVLGSLQNQALGVMNSIVTGITGMITDIINNAVNQISGVVNQLLQIQATILATIGIIEQTIKDLKKLVNDIINFRADQDNCRFAAAEMLKCVAGSLIGDLSKKLAKNVSSGTSSIENLVGKASFKLSQPGNVIERYTSKISNSVDKATSQINATKLI